MKTIFIILLCSFINYSKAGSPYEYPQKNKTFYRIVNDENQVKPNKITRDNLFEWTNLKYYVRFRLWTRKNPEKAQELKIFDEESLRTSNFNPKKLTKIIIHGFAESASEVAIGPWMIHMRDAFLAFADVNVIVLDYTIFAVFVFYLTAFPEIIAERLTEMLLFLNANETPLSSFHLIGWSWGAHIAGLSGHSLNGKLGQITGCDPAGPSFRFLDNEFRLDKADAQFVQIIHTNGGTRLLWGGYYGLYDALGHVDIYPNGGQRQIGCPLENSLVYETLYCNHGRAVQYLTESIGNPLAFPICKCDTLENYVKAICPCEPEDIEFMGEHLNWKARGIYQIITRPAKPFGHGPHLNLKIPSNTNEDTIELSYKNRTRNFPFKNTYLSKYWPNDDVTITSLNIIKELNKIHNDSIIVLRKQ